MGAVKNNTETKSYFRHNIYPFIPQILVNACDFRNEKD